MTRLTDEEYEALSTQHGGDVARVETAMGTVVMRPASRTECKIFMDSMTGGNKAKGLERLVRVSIVHPTLDVLDQWLEKKGLIMLALTKAASDLAGASEVEVEKK